MGRGRRAEGDGRRAEGDGRRRRRKRGGALSWFFVYVYLQIEKNGLNTERVSFIRINELPKGHKAMCIQIVVNIWGNKAIQECTRLAMVSNQLDYP